jgi:hypothetical protein
MIFADLLAGEAIFLDANTLVYHFVSEPLPSSPDPLPGAQSRLRDFTV